MTQLNITFIDQADSTMQGKLEGLRSSPTLSTTLGHAWMNENLEPFGIIFGIARIMHPEQYVMGMSMLRAMTRTSKFSQVLPRWPSVFSALSVVVNRMCPMHREQKGDCRFFDILASCGQYTSTSLHLQPVGFQIPNGPGTVVGFSGKALRHGVGHADGDRTCIAFYMRESIRSCFRVRPCGWMRQEVYRECIGPRQNTLYKALSPSPFAL